MNLEQVKEIHFIGIGGISMSGFAKMLKDKGHIVTGSDARAGDATKELQSAGIHVEIGHRPENISETAELVVYTAAISEDNEELSAARARGIPCISRSELLTGIANGYPVSICVAGTHGKTTTTSLITDIFCKAEKDPTVSVGAHLSTINGNYRIGRSDFCIVEADEYSDTILTLEPQIGIILNIDNDHMEHFGTIENVENAFRKFAHNIRKQGVLIINDDIKNIGRIIEGLECKVLRYGREKSEADECANGKENGYWYPKNFDKTVAGGSCFEVWRECGGVHELMGRISLDIPGEHTAFNATAACAAAYETGISFDEIEKGLNGFKGASRRFEIKGHLNGVTVMDDYAHHPTEIKAVLSAVKGSYNKVWCAFQPHNYSRLKGLMDDFSTAFDDADRIVLLDIYSSRETSAMDIHSTDLLQRLVERGKETYYFANFKDAGKFLKGKCCQGDLLITMGAGDVYKLGESLFCTEFSTLSTES